MFIDLKENECWCQIYDEDDDDDDDDSDDDDVNDCNI